MLRNLQTLGLVLAALLTTSALGGVTGAEATESAEFHCTAATTSCIVEGTSTIGVLKASGATVKCATEGGAKYTSTILKTGTTATVKATYGNTATEKGCLVNGSKAVVHMNGCDYDLTSVEPEASLEGTAEAAISCPAGANIEITGPGLPCTFKIGTQAGLKHITFVNSKGVEPTTATANITLKNITLTKAGVGCPEGEGAGTGELTDTVVFKGFNDETAVGPQVGIHVFSIGQATEPAEFHCTSVATNCTAEGSSTIGVLKASGATVKCATEGGAKYSLTIAKTGTTATVNATYGNTATEKGCLVNGSKGVVHMNGCDYDLNSVGPEAGLESTTEAAVTCPVGANIEITGPALPCTFKIGTQKGLKHVTFTNTKAAEPTNLIGNITLKNIALTKTGVGCPEGEGAGTGELTDTVVLRGFEEEPVKGTQVGFHVFSGPQVEEPPELHCTATTVNCIAEGSSNVGVFNFEGATVKCATEGGAKYTSTIPKTGKTATVNATYGNTATEKGCLFGGTKLVIHMNGCDYDFTSVKPEASLEGTAEAAISCPVGASIEMTVPALSCTFKIGAQKNLKHITFTNSKTAEPTTVTANFALKNIALTKIGTGCFGGEGPGTMSLTDAVLFKGFNDESGVKGAQVGLHVF